MNYTTIPELARMIGCTRARAWQMMKEKKFKATKVSHVYVVTENEAKKVLKAKQEKQTKKQEKIDEQLNGVSAR